MPYTQVARMHVLSYIGAFVIITGICFDNPSGSTSAQARKDERSLSQQILDGLRQSHGKDLERYLMALQNRSHDDPLDNSDIDEIIEELRHIEKEDPFEAPRKFKLKHQPTNPPMYHPNRVEAKRLIEDLQRRKIANDFRTLPLPERVGAIMDVFEGRRSTGIHGGSGWFRSELVRCGQEAVPLIVKNAPTSGYATEAYVSVLGQIGSRDAADYLTRVFQDRVGNNQWNRCRAMEAITPMSEEKFILALIEELEDESSVNMDRCLGQTSRSDNEPCNATYFQIQHCASKALTRATGRDWGPIFNEDYRTWAAWRDSTDRTGFQPSSLSRDEAETRRLAAKLLQREMSGRPMANMSATPATWKEETGLIGERMRRLGTIGVEAVMEEFERRARELKNPNAFEKLKDWTSRVLLAIGTPEARNAAVAISEYNAPASP